MRYQKAADDEVMDDEKDIETDATHDDEGDENDGDDTAVVEKDEDSDEFVQKPSAEVLASLHRHYKDAEDYIDEKCKDLDHPGVLEALDDHKNKHLHKAMSHIKEVLHNHHGEDGDDPDSTMDKHTKALETDGTGGGETQPGEAGAVSNGNVPPDDEKSYYRSKYNRWRYQKDFEENMTHDCGKDLDEDDVENKADSSIINDFTHDQKAADGSENTDTEEILERYETPKGWKTRKAGFIRRAKNGKAYLVRKEMVDDEDKKDLTGPGANDNDPAEDGNTPDYTKAIDDEDIEAVKAAGDFLEEVAEDDSLPKMFKSVAKSHGRSLNKVYTKAVNAPLNDAGKVQRNGGPGSPLTDQGKEERNGGKGSELTNEGPIEANSGPPAGKVSTGKSVKTKPKLVSEKEEKEFLETKRLFELTTGIKINGNN